ncbi:hypothetical protein PVAND_016713 [Polypedilum vanderplanki]|uniref:Uncharacterized protein n=1 Tax=Polypedilum vanderplanki TaxID=319348 RepID=A0A9J6BGZ9_POLVA|nr:hypothetical protein PVAND_016713 [Polypedilum vanderplanki]
MFSVKIFVTISILSLNFVIAQSSREIKLNCEIDKDQRDTEEFFTYVTCNFPDDVKPEETLSITSNNLDMATLRHQNKSVKVKFETTQNYPAQLPTHLATHLYGTTNFYYQNSPLEKIHRCDFRDFGHRITLIDLAHNQIKEIPHDTFHDLHSLSYLSIEHNHVKKLEADTFKHAPQLTTLIIRNNQINELHPELFKHSTQFYVLYGEHNHITELCGDLFEKNSQMEIISLKQNRISKVDVDFREFKNLSLVDLTGNADGCDFMYFNNHPYEAKGYSEMELKKWEKDLDIFQKNVEENCQA